MSDSEAKHFHEIKKHYAKSYEKYLKNGKYLLIRVDEVEENGIYLPRGIKIVHFGEIESQGECNHRPAPAVENPPPLQHKDSGKLEASCKGLSMEIS